MKNKCYSCPFCQQTSSRKWNLQVHLARKHPGLGWPLQNLDERSSGAPNKYSSKRLIPSTEGQENLSDTRPVSYILKSLHAFLQTESFFDNLSPRGGPHHVQMPMWVPNRISFPTLEEFLDQLTLLSSTSKTDPFRPHISGYERYTCRLCLVTSPLPFIVIKGTGKVFRTQHSCNRGALAQMQKLTEYEKNCMFLHQNKSSIDVMQNAIKDQWTDGKSPYLIIKKLPSVPRNSYDFSSEIEQGCEWLNRVIREESILLDDEQLKEFLFLSDGNSYVSFSVRQGDLQVYQAYFMTLSKEPSFSIDFSIENPQILPFNPPQNVWLSPDQTLIYPKKEN